MKRTVSLLVLVALLALAAVACSAPAPAATVNGHDISCRRRDPRRPRLRRVGGVPPAAVPAGRRPAADGHGPDRFAAQWLVSLIQSEAISQYAAKKHVKAPTKEVAQARSSSPGRAPERGRVRPAAEVAAEPARADHRAPARAAVVAQAVGERREAGLRLHPAVGRLPEQEAHRAHPRPDRRGGAAGRRPRAKAARASARSRARCRPTPARPRRAGSSCARAARSGHSSTKRSGPPPKRCRSAQISAPVQTQFGYHVIEALELTPENAQPLGARRGAVRRPARAGHRQVPQAVQDHREPTLRQDLRARATRSRSSRRRRRRSAAFRPTTPSTTVPAGTGGTGAGQSSSSTTPPASP